MARETLHVTCIWPPLRRTALSILVNTSDIHYNKLGANALLATTPSLTILRTFDAAAIIQQHLRLSPDVPRLSEHQHGCNARRRRWTAGTTTSRTVVLRDACVHKMVDNSDGGHGSSGTMSHHHTLPAVLQLSGGVPQKPGMLTYMCPSVSEYSLTRGSTGGCLQPSYTLDHCHSICSSTYSSSSAMRVCLRSLLPAWHTSHG